MPVVIVPVQAHEKMSEGDIERLVRYVRTARLQDTKQDAEEKLAFGFGGAMNMPGEEDGASPAAQTLWFVNMLRANGRGKRPVLHHVMSWDAGDPLPTPEQVRMAVGVLERRLGLEGCACMWAAHRNTKNFHVHILSSQVDPETLRMRRIGMSVRRALEAQCEANERLGLGHYERDLYVMQPDGNVVRKPERPKDESPPLPSGAKAAENRTATKSMIRIAREHILPVIQGAQTWEEMHRRLADAGSGIAPRKGGLVVLVGDTWIKASSIANECSRKALERRLGGAFTPATPSLEVHAQAEEFRPKPVLGRPKAEAPKLKKKLESAEQTVSLSSAPSAPCFVPGQPIVVPMPMDDELLMFWRRWRRDAVVRRREQERWAEERRRERVAVMESVRAGVRRAGQLVRDARAKAKARRERLVRGVVSMFKVVLEEDGKRRRRELSVRQQVTAGSRPRFADSFASWLRAQGRPDLAERWRKRQCTVPVSVQPPQAGCRMQARTESAPMVPLTDAPRQDVGTVVKQQGAGRRLQSRAPGVQPAVVPAGGTRLERGRQGALPHSVPETAHSLEPPAEPILDPFADVRRLRKQAPAQIPLSVPQVVPEPEEDTSPRPC